MACYAYTWGTLNPCCKVGGARPAGARVAVQLSVAVLHDVLHDALYDALHDVLRSSSRPGSPPSPQAMPSRERGARKEPRGSRGRRFGVE